MKVELVDLTGAPVLRAVVQFLTLAVRREGVHGSTTGPGLPIPEPDHLGRDRVRASSRIGARIHRSGPPPGRRGTPHCVVTLDSLQRQVVARLEHWKEAGVRRWGSI